MPTDLDKAVERVSDFVASIRGLLRQEGRTLDPADIVYVLTALSTRDAELAAAREVIDALDELRAMLKDK